MLTSFMGNEVCSEAQARKVDRKDLVPISLDLVGTDDRAPLPRELLKLGINEAQTRRMTSSE